MSLPDGVGIVGDGRLDLALAHLVAEDRPAWLYVPDEARRQKVLKKRALPELVPEVKKFQKSLSICREFEGLPDNCRLVVLTGSLPPLEGLLKTIGDHLNGSHQIVHAAHRLSVDGLRTTSSLIREYTPCIQIGAIAGPLHVGELLANSPNAAVIGSAFPRLIDRARSALERKHLRIYPRYDLLGVEYAAALVQIVSVVVGLADELKLGAATHATIIARGLAEMTRLGSHLGSSDDTFSGLAGLGRLVDGARRGEPNYDLGKQLARGTDGTELLGEGSSRGGGLHLVGPVRRYADEHGIWMPITTVIDEILRGRLSAQQGIQALLDTPVKPEGD